MPPVIYLFHGEDELSITQALHALEGKLGDPTSAALNAERLDGRAITLEELRGAVSAIPFFGGRRLVVVFNPLAKTENNPASQEKLLNLLGQVPETTALVLVEFQSLSGDSKKKENWLLNWAKSAGSRVLVRHYPALKGAGMEKFILQQAKSAGGEFTLQAANRLAPLVGDDTRLANQEVNKLLAYVNYRRAVEPEDVDALAVAAGQADIFALVDALGNQDEKRAMNMLHQLLDELDVLSLFGMIVRQFRFLLLAREVMDEGGGSEDVLRRIPEIRYAFVAQKILGQARHFTLPALEGIYWQLLDVDEKIKTGQMEGDTALEVFVAGLSASPVWELGKRLK